VLLGEVADAKAAVAWLRRQPEIDPACLYVVGHSIGGGIAAQLSLHPDAGIRATASIGGIYRAHTFHHWASRRGSSHLVRFEPTDSREVALRLLVPNVRDVVHPHLAYAGADDEFDARYAALAADRAREAGTPVEQVVVGGDHMSSVHAALGHWIERILDDPTCNRKDLP
jgi:acetyl esterase/lipase